MSDHYNVNLQIAFRNTEATEPLKEYASEKITHCLKKYIHQDTEVHLVLDVEKKRQIAEVSLNCFGTNFTCKKESENMYKTLDQVVESIGKQLRRHKDKVTDHHA